MARKILSALSALMIGGMVVACGTPGSAGDDSSEAIKVAIIPPSSGALAEFGSDAADAWQFAVDEVNENGGVAGRQIELVRSDTDATAATTLRAAREAVTQQGAQFIGAVMTSTEHGALNAQLEGLGALSFNGLGKDNALTGKDCNPNAFRAVQSTAMDMNAIAESLATLPGDRWAIQAVDYSTGHSSVEVFKEAAAKAGKTVVLEQYAPLNTTEFGSYISQIVASDADALFAVEYGADGVAFVNQAAQFNLSERFQTVLGFNMVSEPLFPAIGDKVVGFYNSLGYDVDADNTLNTEFVEAWADKHDGEKPYYVVADNYLAAQVLFEGIEAADSADPEDVKAALADLTFDSIAGEVTMRGGDHQLVRPSYLGQVVRDDSGALKFDAITESAGADITPPVDSQCSL